MVDDGDLPNDVEDAVLAALELDDAERDAALAALFARHPRHAAAVRAWLRAAGVPVPAEEPAAPTADDHEHIGPYRLLRVLGRGGFGTVWLAEQTVPLRRQVAIKVLNPGMDSREVLARFAAEREALLRMNHPGIAQLLDAGTTGEGRPFFAMEYVAGQPLAAHCRQHAFDLPTRLHLFLAVLDAVQHAHQKAILHRDLSSNNVLVADLGGRLQPKIIDFGIAKSLATPLPGAAMTFQGTLMGTPEFMSPEQAAGLPDVDTRTDIWSLGVQLYELLTEQLPIPTVVLRAEGVAGVAKVIREHPIAAPSAVAPRASQSALRGDLDWITMKALARSVDERYATVAEFAGDLRRHLEHQPVMAGPPSTWYLLRKFARRNRSHVIAAAIALCCLLAGLLFSLWSWRQLAIARADEQRAQQQLRERADAGFRLLANDTLLHRAVEQERTLPPPWPSALPAYDDWLRTFATPMLEQATVMAQRLENLEQRRAQDGGRFSDSADEHLHGALLRLLAEVRRFLAPGGLVADVQSRRAFAHDVATPAAKTHASAWQQAIATIKASDGIGAAADYRGLQLQPQPGLVPLGMDPTTRLFECLDLASHDPLEPIPVRDPQTGALRVGARTGIVFVLLPQGSFRMGAVPSEIGFEQNDPFARDDERPLQTVSLSEFLIGRCEVTVAQWRRLLGQAGSGGDLMPIANIDWQRAWSTLQRYGMTLPTEAQWEYACRAGTMTPWSWGDDPAQVRQHCGPGPDPQVVALFLPNQFGLFDLHGNVGEWCLDWLVDYASAPARSLDGLRLLAQPSGLRVVRGGSAADRPEAQRSAARAGRAPGSADSFVGVRAVRAITRNGR
ncbi:MAG: SUMF1/EgtB/PvdO family nonheme iron enzyme [Planctomycetes bacterium]|nr:SUMF1/EgtB/PvdO family nonheme iron enzyme [Planctomycetota bacterium]